MSFSEHTHLLIAFSFILPLHCLPPPNFFLLLLLLSIECSRIERQFLCSACSVLGSVSQLGWRNQTKRNDDDDYFYYYYREVAGAGQQQCKLGSYFSAFPPLSLVIDPVVEAKSKKKQWKMTLVFGGSVRVFLLSALYGTVRSMQRKSWRLLILASSCLYRPPILFTLSVSALEFFYCTKQKTVQLYSSESVCVMPSAFYFLSAAVQWLFRSRSVKPVSYTFSSLDSLFWHAVITSLNAQKHMWQWTGKKWKGDDGIREWKEAEKRRR